MAINIRVLLRILVIISLSACAPRQDPFGGKAPTIESTAATRLASSYAAVNGLYIYYEIHGDGGSKNFPLVLLHGGGATIETSFEKVLPSLAGSRQVIVFEQQGHGRTADIDRPFSFEQSADDAAGLLARLEIESADFFGYGDGGNIALRVAMRHPKLVRKLVVASAMYKRDGLYPEFWKALKATKGDSLRDELRNAYLKVAPFPDRLSSLQDKYAKRILAFKDWPAKDLKSIQAPTMVMIGDSDVVRPEHAVQMYRLLPHGRLAVLPGTDHMKVMKRAQWQASMIKAFLDERMP